MAVFCNPNTLQAISRPVEMEDSLKDHGFILVQEQKTETKVEEPKTAKKAKKD